MAITEGDDQFKEGVMWPYLLMVNASVNETKYSKAVCGSQLYQSRYNLRKNYRAVEDSIAGEYFFEGQISCKKGTRVYKKGLAGVDKAFNSKAVQEALQLATQMAEMPSVRLAFAQIHDFHYQFDITDLTRKRPAATQIFDWDEDYGTIVDATDKVRVSTANLGGEKVQSNIKERHMQLALQEHPAKMFMKPLPGDFFPINQLMPYSTGLEAEISFKDSSPPLLTSVEWNTQQVWETLDH